MDPENKQEDKEKLVESLHNKDKLQSLRTYQGDVADFIQSKDQSLSDLALKNRAEKEKREERRPAQAEPGAKSSNIFIYILGLVLLVASAAILSYLAFSYLKNKPIDVQSDKTNSIIKADRAIPLGDGAILGSILIFKSDPKYKTGITALELPIPTEELVEKLKWKIPDALIRSLQPNFLLGLYGNGDTAQFFLILKTKDYGIAYRDMLAWEKEMPNDFKTLISVASSTQYAFKDLIVKNKDTRSYAGQYSKTALIYTFLNQETILITESDSALTALVNAFATGNITR